MRNIRREWEEEERKIADKRENAFDEVVLELRAVRAALAEIIIGDACDLGDNVQTALGMVDQLIDMCSR